MKHLTVDEMIGFVSMDTLDAQGLALATQVTTHICRCAQCREKIRAFQAIFDEMTATGDRRGFPTAAKLAAEYPQKTKTQTQRTMTRYD